MRNDLKEAILRLPASERGFDTSRGWLHPGEPEHLDLPETVRMVLANVSELSGFFAAQLAAGGVFEVENDVRVLEVVCRETRDALEVLDRAVVELRREVTTTREGD